MNIIVHIGGEKCGSSSIQRFLSRNRRSLLNQNILVPTTPGNINHTKLTVFSESDGHFDSLRRVLQITSDEKLQSFRKDFKSRLYQEVQSSSCQTVVLSNEHCSSRLRSQEEVNRLKQLLTPISKSITIVLYARPQDEVTISAYSTQVKSGVSRPFAFPASYDDAPFATKYLEICQLWASVFGHSNIRAFPIHKSHLGVQDVVRHFSQLLQIKEDGIVYGQSENKSLDVNKLRFLIDFNSNVPLFDKGVFNRMRARIVSSLERSPETGPNLSAPYKDRLEYLRNFAPSNARFLKHYCGIESNIFASPQDRKAAATIPESLPSGTVMNILADMLREYDKKYSSSD